MRLLNVYSLSVDSFPGEAPEYAILSHTWEDGEVTLQDLEKGAGVERKMGFGKIQHVCDIAKRAGLKWVWIDTCCIDKTSSAELSEAINSMFMYYQQAKICYAYIADVKEHVFSTAYTTGHMVSHFPKCKWLTRGWTLQELIAPRSMDFYSAEWVNVGSKDSFAESLSRATGIPAQSLKAGDVSSVAVCEKMRWLATRETTRPEDLAYCALGIFDINMPLLYGEGKDRAFRRLQEEILRASDDPTIFLWTADETDTSEFWGLLAQSPSQFQNSPMKASELGSIISVTDSSTATTSQGLAVSWQVAPVRGDQSGTLFVAFLARRGRVMYTLLLQKMDYAGVTFARVAAHTKIHVVITGNGKKAMLAPSGRHDASNFPTQSIHPGDTHLRRFTVKHNPAHASQSPTRMAVGFSFDLSKHKDFKIGHLAWNKQMPELAFEGFEAQSNLLFHRFTTQDLNHGLGECQGGKPHILAALRLTVTAPDYLGLSPNRPASAAFPIVFGIAPVESSSIGTMAPFVRPRAMFVPRKWWDEPLEIWIDAVKKDLTFFTDDMTIEHDGYKITIRCSFSLKMLLAEPYYDIALTGSAEQLPAPADAPQEKKDTQPGMFSKPPAQPSPGFFGGSPFNFASPPSQPSRTPTTSPEGAAPTPPNLFSTPPGAASNAGFGAFGSNTPAFGSPTPPFGTGRPLFGSPPPNSSTTTASSTFGSGPFNGSAPPPKFSNPEDLFASFFAGNPSANNQTGRAG
jgi:hypothetical protein